MKRNVILPGGRHFFGQIGQSRCRSLHDHKSVSIFYEVSGNFWKLHWKILYVISMNPVHWTNYIVTTYLLVVCTNLLLWCTAVHWKVHRTLIQWIGVHWADKSIYIELMKFFIGSMQFSFRQYICFLVSWIRIHCNN